MTYVVQTGYWRLIDASVFLTLPIPNSKLYVHNDVPHCTEEDNESQGMMHARRPCQTRTIGGEI